MAAECICYKILKKPTKHPQSQLRLQPVTITNILPALVLPLSILSVEFGSGIRLSDSPPARAPCRREPRRGHRGILGPPRSSTSLCFPIDQPHFHVPLSLPVYSPAALTYAHTIHQLFSIFVNEGTFYELEEHMPPCGLTLLPAPRRQPPPHPVGGLRQGEASLKPAHGLKIAHGTRRDGRSI